MIAIPDGGLEAHPSSPPPGVGLGCGYRGPGSTCPRSGLPSPFLPIYQLLRRR